MSDELFSVPVVKSPRLAWLEKHGVKTKHFPDRAQSEPFDEDEDGDELYPWVAFAAGGHMHGGVTEDEAVCGLAIRMGWLLWNEEGYKP
jgi:hypothetical protein